MSKFSEISSKIGWVGPGKISVPTKQEALQLFERVAGKDEQAFEQVLTLYRFVQPIGLNLEEQGIMNLIGEAYEFGTQVFGGMR